VTGAKDFSCVAGFLSSITFRSMDSVDFCLVTKKTGKLFIEVFGTKILKNFSIFYE